MVSSFFWSSASWYRVCGHNTSYQPVTRCRRWWWVVGYSNNTWITKEPWKRVMKNYGASWTWAPCSWCSEATRERWLQLCLRFWNPSPNFVAVCHFSRLNPWQDSATFITCIIAILPCTCGTNIFPNCWADRVQKQFICRAVLLVLIRSPSIDIQRNSW